MNIAELAPHALEYASLLRAVNPNISVEHVAANEPFIKIYRDVVPSSAGAYVFHVPQDIVYIGKALNFRQRIWFHINAPAKQMPDDDRYFFPDSRFLDENAMALYRDDIYQGNFMIDYFEISVPELSDGLEVFIQSIYFAKMGRLPFGNKQFG